MAELRDVDIRTLSIMTGPFKLVSVESDMADSTFRQGRWERGLILTVENKNGLNLRATISKKDMLYHRLSAYLVEGKVVIGQLINITWDEKNGTVIFSGALKGA